MNHDPQNPKSISYTRTEPRSHTRSSSAVVVWFFQDVKQQQQHGRSCAWDESGCVR